MPASRRGGLGPDAQDERPLTGGFAVAAGFALRVQEEFEVRAAFRPERQDLGQVEIVLPVRVVLLVVAAGFALGQALFPSPETPAAPRRTFR